VYDASDFYLVANAIDRYSIGDRTAGLLTDDDGSATIYIQRHAPDNGRQSNWLPTPDGRFRPLLMRMYQPCAEILNGEYTSCPPSPRLGSIDRWRGWAWPRRPETAGMGY
jgi:hypothetical protein